MLAGKVACPHCRVVLKSSKSLPVGKRVKCPGCGASFAVGRDSLDTMVGNAPRTGIMPRPLSLPRAVPRRSPAPPGRSWKALLLILLGAGIFLGGGTYVAIQCFSSEQPADPKQLVKNDTDDNDLDLNDGPPPDKGVPEHKPVPPPPGPKAPRSFLTPPQENRVKSVVGRGIGYLKSTQNPDGSWSNARRQKTPHQTGFTALAGLTLLECGVPKTDPVIQKAVTYLRRLEQSPRKIAATYELSLTILFLDRLDDPQDRPLLQKLTMRLVAGQGPSGGWTYTCPVLTDPDSELLATLLGKHNELAAAGASASKLNLKSVDETKLQLDAGGMLSAQLKKLAVWRNDTMVRGQKSDNSNTQFAILALLAAKSRNLPVQRSLVLIVKRFRKGQNKDGSWGYHATGTQVVSQYPTMTCAGLLGLAVGQGLTNEIAGRAPGQQAAHLDPAIQRGLAVVARKIENPHNPWKKAKQAPLINLYFLWSVERVGVIFGLSKIGNKDWYGWGAEKLVANQVLKGQGAGSWKTGDFNGNSPTVNTCFALLFLQRVNLARDLTAKLVLLDD